LARLAVYDQLARHTGAHAIDTQFVFQSVYVHCIRGDLAQADVQLQRIAPRLAQLGRLDEAQYRVLLGWRAALAGRLDEAQRLLHEAVDDTRRRRFAFLEAVARGLLGELLAMAGQAEAARTMADQALALARQMDSVTAEVPCAVARAAVAEWTDEPAAKRDHHLADALAAVRRHGHWAWGGLFPPTLARLMQRALQRGIEVDTARELIRRRRLPPPAGADGSWPWPLRLRAFGELQLWADDQPIGRGGGKASQRPLDLLRALLAQAPRPLPVHLALQWIWGDADATDQRKAFDVALLRARRLLGDDRGDDSLLRLEGGQLSFDSGRVWTDVDALLALADRVGAADADPAHAMDWAAQLLDLARGPLLPDDESPWVRTARERLRRRCAATAERLAAWLAPAQPALARELLQRSFDNDPASEPLARQLAGALASAGDRREACRVLSLCQATRALTGEAPVGSETRALFERLQG
jgi:DNA-binding SARP family transcriptional activator